MKDAGHALRPIGAFVSDVGMWSPNDDTPDDERSYIDIASIDREVKKIAACMRITPQNAPSRARQVVRQGDVLVSTVRPNLNAVAMVPQDLDGQIASTGFCVLRSDGTNLCNRYLFHWVQSPPFIAAMTRQATGASYPAVSDRIVKCSPLPLPPLAEQKRIADILDKADDVRRKRRESHRVAKRLPLIIFSEMFMQTIKDEDATRTLGSLADIASGVTKGRRFNGAETHVVPYLRVANVQAGFLDLGEIKTIEALPAEIQSLALQRGDVVMTEGGDLDKLGRGALWEHDIPNCIHQNHIFRVRPDREILLPVFFVTYLQTARAKGYFLQCAKKTTNLATINMRQLKALPVPIPSMGEQLRFETRVHTFRTLADRQSAGESAANKLCESLADRAFHGEL